MPNFERKVKYDSYQYFSSNVRYFLSLDTCIRACIYACVLACVRYACIHIPTNELSSKSVIFGLF